MTWPYPIFFAHRGGGTLAPENTLAAIRTGQRCGFKAVEFDVKLSADRVAVLLHDDTLTRTTNASANHEAARDTLYQRMALLNAGAWHSAAFQHEPIPRFDAVCWHLRAHQLLANVEIKPCPGRERLTAQIVVKQILLDWPDWPDQRNTPPLVSSFAYESLVAARELSATLPLGYLCQTPTADDLARARALGCVSLHCWEGAASPALVAEAHAAQLKLLLWTVNDVARAQTLIDWGVDGLFTDALATFAHHFKL